MTACPDPLALTRAIARGADASGGADAALDALDAHLADCPACRAAWDADVRLIALARQVPVRTPSADQREELRTAILAAGAQLEPPALRAPSPASASAPMRRRARWIAGAIAVAAAAAVLTLVLGRGGTAPRPRAHGTIHAHAGARYVASAPPDEIVTLHDGSIDVDVTPLHAGERFRVITADAEVEVHGTAFVVTARLGHLAGVTVHHGLVEVRPHDGPIKRLGAGQSWSAADRTAAAPPTATPPPTPPTVAATTPPTVAATLPPAAATTPPPTVALPARSAIASPQRVAVRRSTMTTPAASSPSVGSATASAASLEAATAPAPSVEPLAPTDPATRPPQDVAYDQAWAAMRAERFASAATAFARVAVLDSDGPLAEDASYWYAVALARAHRTEATTAFRDFLDRHPRSPHTAEASVMLGWILVEADQRTEAARRFRAALDDPDAAVHASARAGLDALGVR